MVLSSSTSQTGCRRAAPGEGHGDEAHRREASSCSPLMAFLLCCSREHRGASTQLKKALVLEELSPVLRNTNFSCVFTDPEYTVQRHVVLADLLAGLRTLMPPTQEASRGFPLPHHPDR
uniref:Interleukin 18 binding protein n=1 Tax=Myotis myotis TaxID=51298 RepID=A0A7J7VHG3_MYOMY|nr:interleukin 18 binding protein [Myotis myotis]